MLTLESLYTGHAFFLKTSLEIIARPLAPFLTRRQGTPTCVATLALAGSVAARLPCRPLSPASPRPQTLAAGGLAPRPAMRKANRRAAPASSPERPSPGLALPPLRLLCHLSPRPDALRRHNIMLRLE